MENITVKDDGILIKLRISPNASKNQIINDGNIIKLKITAQPIEGKANKAVVEYLSKLFKVAKTNISIVKGDTSKEKTIFISVTDPDKKSSIQKLLLGE